MALPSGVYSIFNAKAPWAVLDMSGDDDTSIISYQPNDQDNQKWNFIDLGDGTWHIQNATGEFLSFNGAAEPNVPIVGQDESRQWVVNFEPSSSKIFDIETGLYIEQMGTDIGATCQLAPYSPYSNQSWNFQTE